MATTADTSAQVQELVLTARPLAPETYARYGRIVGLERIPMEMRDGRFTANLVALGAVPDQIGGINRHMDHTQLFIPLAGAPTLVVLAPRDVPADEFDPALIEAFVADGSFAYTFDAGTWHIEPKALDPTNNRVINVQTDVYRAYTELVRFANLGVGLRIRVPER